MKIEIELSGSNWIKSTICTKIKEKLKETGILYSFVATAEDGSQIKSENKEDDSCKENWKQLTFLPPTKLPKKRIIQLLNKISKINR